MQEKELRIAVVLTGGISLAVYMHGISKELLKLTRASRALHREDGVDDGYADSAPGREVDTEPIYYDLLKSLSPRLDLRVVIDVIAGSSAGGVNGITLARALAHDLDIDSQRRIWLQRADVTHLVADKEADSWWRRAYMAPLTALLSYSRLKQLAPEQETREKLSSFVRSRWFHPPFSGERFTSWLLEAFSDMDAKSPENGSLLPDGHPLDLFVSVTDFYGHANRIALHDPPIIEEREHRHLLNFCYMRPREGEHLSEFERDMIPGLAFAARATSSFPGAFPPVSIKEIDAALKARGETWARRDDFLESKLGSIVVDRDNGGVGGIRLIDGSVVNDKPFGIAARAISQRSAQREVMRRIVFVDPNPIDAVKIDETGDPSFFRTLLASMAEIPRNEPIHDDLNQISSLNANIRLVGQVLRQSRPLVDSFVDGILPGASKDIRPTADEIASWRGDANEQAATRSGYAFQGYFRLKTLRVSQGLESLIARLGWDEPHREIPPHARLGYLAALGERGVTVHDLHETNGSTEATDAEIDFLKMFDVDFRTRRLRFVIRRLNELYRDVQQGSEADDDIDTSVARLNELKNTLYGELDSTRHRWKPAYFDPGIIEPIKGAIETGTDPGPEAFNKVIDGLGKAMALQKADAAADEIFAVMVLNYIPEHLRRDLFAAYLGFSFFDVMSFPMVQWEEIDEFEEILIDRISPMDSTTIRSGGTPEILKGISLRRFGAFFNRSYRENDYLWGRLNAADRLVDIVLGAVGEAVMTPDTDVCETKDRLFHAILDAEEPFLKADPDLIRNLREEVKAACGDAQKKTV